MTTMKPVENESGLRPIEYRVVVKPDVVEDRSEGGIIIPQQANEMQQWAQVKGTLIACGGKAFKDYPEDEAVSMVPGARVCWSQYEGTTFYGADDEEYKLLNDKNITGIVLDERAVPLSSIRARSRRGLDAA